MAWSDAARAAAVEVRRRHKSDRVVRRVFVQTHTQGGYTSKPYKSGVTSTRQHIARSIRRLRGKQTDIGLGTVKLLRVLKK